MAAGLIVGLLAASGPRVYGQEVERTAHVTYLAGPNVYLDAGIPAGLARHDTLQVFREARRLGLLRVLSSSDRGSVATFAGEAFALAVGDTLVLRFRPSRPVVAPPEPETVAPARPSLLDPAPASRDRRPRPKLPLVHGLVAVQSNLLRSTTGVTADHRVFATPGLRLRTTVSRLPGDLRLDVHLNASYRYTTGVAIDPALSTRLYRASLTRSFDRLPLDVSFGRFYSPAERYSGYWDGLLLYSRRGVAGLGAASGFQPDRWNEGFSVDLPKYSVFGDVDYRRGGLRYAADVSFHEVRPRNHLLRHTFAGWSQQVRWQGLRLDQHLQVDRNEATSRWVVSRLQLRAGLALPGRLRAQVRYAVRQPHSLWRTTDVFSLRRDQAGAGLYYRREGRSLGVDVSTSRLAGGTPSYSYMATAAVPPSDDGRPGAFVTAGWWTYGERRSLHVSPGLERPFGPVGARLRYRLYRTSDPAVTLTTHAADLSLDAPLADRLHAALQIRTQWGSALASTGLYVSLSKSF